MLAQALFLAGLPRPRLSRRMHFVKKVRYRVAWRRGHVGAITWNKLERWPRASDCMNVKQSRPGRLSQGPWAVLAAIEAWQNPTARMASFLPIDIVCLALAMPRVWAGFSPAPDATLLDQARTACMTLKISATDAVAWWCRNRYCTRERLVLPESCGICGRVRVTPPPGFFRLALACPIVNTCREWRDYS